MTATQFAWSCLARGDYPPKKKVPFALDPVCWLCGGETSSRGWPRDELLPKTFTDHPQAAAPSSRGICQSCAALISGETWRAYVADHPDKGLKAKHPVQWRTYSHVFAHGLHECPSRAQWRTWLLSPPAPPFLMAISTSGKKHVIFRGQIAYSRDYYPVQFEECTLHVPRPQFAECLSAVEAAYQAGFSKEQIVSGRYTQTAIMKAGLRQWRGLEEQVAPWRRRQLHLLKLSALCAQKEDDDLRSRH